MTRQQFGDFINEEGIPSLVCGIEQRQDKMPGMIFF